MNITLSLDDRLLARAREAARRRGVSLNQLVREFLEHLTSESDPDRLAVDMERLWAENEGASAGWKWNRDELHDRALLR